MNLDEILKAPTTPEQLLLDVRARTHARWEKRGFSPTYTARYIEKKHPELKTQILEDAEYVLRGKLILTGARGQRFLALGILGERYTISDPPDWHAVPYNDMEYLFDVNRHFHWTTLLQAYALTGARRYADKVVSELLNWIECCPRPDAILGDGQLSHYRGISPWRLLEIGIRMYDTWPWVIEFLIDTEIMTPSILGSYAASVYNQGEALYRFPPLADPNVLSNHTLMANLGLLYLSANFPEFDASDKWLAHAISELNRCAKAQFGSPDGGHIEACPHYHNLCAYLFFLARIFAKEFGFEFSVETVQSLDQALTYSLHAQRPNGVGVPWGDSDADYFAVTTALYAYLSTDDIAPLQNMFPRVGLPIIQKQAESHIWRVGTYETLADKILNTPPAQALPRVFHERERKQASLRTGWDRDALGVFFACRTPVENGHAHIDPMGFDFTALGKALIVDPGKFCYRNDANRKIFKSAAWHNTLLVNDQDPFEYIDSVRFGPQKEGDILTVIDGGRLLYAEASHRCYEPAIHRRLIAIIDQGAARRFLLILDDIAGVAAGDTIQLYYHVNTTTARWDVEARAAKTGDEGANILIHPTANLRGSLLEGRISDFYDYAVPSQRLKLEDSESTRSRRLYGTLAIPFLDRNESPLAHWNDIREEEDGLSLSFSIDSRDYTFRWTVGDAFEWYTFLKSSE